jgi:hypothetical protein
LTRSANNDHCVYATTPFYNVPSSTWVNSVVVSGSHQNFSGLVVKLAKNGGWIFQWSDLNEN